MKKKKQMYIYFFFNQAAPNDSVESTVCRNTWVDFLKLLISPALSKKKIKVIINIRRANALSQVLATCIILFHCKLTHPYWFMGNKSGPSKC